MHTPPRGPITTRVLTELQTLGFPVGDNSSPEEAYGWQGVPNGIDSTFIPYVGLSPLNGQQQRNQSMSESQSEWALPYQVWYAGISRKQTEALADRMRQNLVNISREKITGETGTWKIQQIRCTVIGANSRVSSTFPDYYTQTDTFEVWITKER